MTTQAKILLVGNYALDGQQSMKRYAEFLKRELAARGYRVELLEPSVTLGGLASPKNPLSKWLGLADKFLLFPRTLRKRAREFDLVHICDHSNAPYLKYVSATPNVITCHDVMGIRSALQHYPENPTVPSARLLRRMQWIVDGLKSAKCVICISRKTEEELLTLLERRPPLQRVIHHSLNWNYQKMSVEEAAPILHKLGLAPKARYLLHVGGNQWYKNRLGVLRIFKELRKVPSFQGVTLVMAGKSWTPEMRAFVSQEALQGVIELVSPSNEQVQALYSGAQALLFPSFHEGFGWPILEAQACGCPVITSNRDPMREIAGAGAVLIDPADPVSAATEIALRLRNQDQLVKDGFVNISRFSKDAMINSYLETYEEVLQGAKA